MNLERIAFAIKDIVEPKYFELT